MKPELLAPAGSPEAAWTAFGHGADAVYVGMRRFSARAEAANFDAAALRDLICAARDVRSGEKPRKVYVAFNTLLRDAERADVLEELETLESLAPDALIVQDLGLAALVRRHFPSLALHASTQMAAHSVEGVTALRDLGFSRVVLARECTFRETARMARECGVELEVFVHGALCHSISGLCLFSALEKGRSGNRGRCAYCCRLQRGGVFPHSMKDLCLSPVFDELLATGAASLKIEGRMKGPLYVACAVDLYRALLDGERDPARIAALEGDLQSVFAREWTTLYARGADAPVSSVADPRSLGHRGMPIGRVERVETVRGSRRIVFRTARPLERHDGLQIKSPAFIARNDGHPFGFAVADIRPAGAGGAAAGAGLSVPAGTLCSVALPPRGAPEVRPGEVVYLAASADVRRRHPPVPPPRVDPVLAGLALDVEVSLSGGGVSARATVPSLGGMPAAVFAPCSLSPARDAARVEDAARSAFAKLGGTVWRPGAFSLSNPESLFAPASALNEARRALVAALDGTASARRAARRAEVEAEARGRGACGERALPDGLTARPGERAGATLKFRVDQDPPESFPPDARRIVLALWHHPLRHVRERLDVWKRAVSSVVGADGSGAAVRLALSLPPVCRDDDATALDETVRALADAGWRDWEVCDLSGARRLRRIGVERFSADGTTLPAHNCAALRELFRLGADVYCASPEQGAEDVAALRAAFPGRVEELARQMPPLFIALTAPASGAGPVRRFPGAPPVVSFAMPGGAGLWITVADRPARTAQASMSGVPVRLDFSWDPPR